MSNAISRVFEKFSRLTGERIHDEKGHEIPDPTPMEPAIGHRPGPTLREQIRAMVLEASREAESAGYESLEEADDFDVGDDYEPESPYELDADLPAVAELKRRKEEAEKVAPATPPKPKKRSVAPDEGASGIESPSDSIEAPEGPERAS